MVRANSACTDQTKEMKTAISILGMLHAGKDRLIFVELTLCDGYIYPDNILPHNAACADVEVPVGLN